MPDNVNDAFTARARRVGVDTHHEPGAAVCQQPRLAGHSGRVAAIGNRVPARAARRAGAPTGIRLDARVGEHGAHGQPLFARPAESRGESAYAIGFVRRNTEIAQLDD